MSRLDPVDLFRDISLRQADALEPPVAERQALQSLQDEWYAVRRRLRRRLVAGIAAAAAVAGAGVTVAAVILSGQPSRPEGGPACHASPAPDSVIVVLEPGTEPVAGCGDLWAEGQLPDPQNPLPAPQPVPPLAVCVGEGGVLQVYPGPIDLCGALGLTPGDTALEQPAEAVAELANRVAEINLEGCAGRAQVEAAVVAVLADLGLSRWTVSASPGTDDASCVKAEVDSTVREVRLHPF